jgi:tetratricopeptide (TPR) repeat protein
MMTENLDETQQTPIGDENRLMPVSDETQGTPAAEETQEIKSTKRPRRVSWFWWFLLAVIILVAVIAVSGFLGYQDGIAQRTSYEVTQVALTLKEQFDLGVQDIEAGRYEVARQRFDYILQLEPGYPGVTDKLTEVLLVLNVTATPTPVPTSTPIPVTPTPDLRGEAELFAQAEDFIRNKEWSEAIQTLETLRKKNPEYRAIDLDGMFYLAFRQRGTQKITAGDLESGIYDLTLAERFGLLDTEADGLRTWARYYITGASFWEVDWSQAVFYFEQVAAAYPNMQDGSGWFASQRYKEALVNYAEWLAGLEDWCAAEQVYIKLRDYTGDPAYDEIIFATADNCR